MYIRTEFESSIFEGNKAYLNSSFHIYLRWTLQREVEGGKKGKTELRRQLSRSAFFHFSTVTVRSGVFRMPLQSCICDAHDYVL